MKRVRADQLLVERGLAGTRAKAQALILAGRVTRAGRRVEKAGEKLPEDVPLEVAEGPRHVSRAGGKLEGALEAFSVDPAGREALDVGASTGGFTQVLLERGASRVAAVDVGRGQLDWSLRTDPRVVVLDGLNARNLEAGRLPFRPSLAVVDVSFISLRLVLPAIAATLAEGGEVVALVKPQFEVGRGKVGPGGIVRDRVLHGEVLHALAAFARDSGWGVHGVAPSLVPGAEGNLEFFLHLVPAAGGLSAAEIARRIDRAVAGAHGDPA
ncbi:MAG TPA: TlyA family RNA methyltransferase [Candidatus Polarisedimenticolaceae bacterium]